MEGKVLHSERFLPWDYTNDWIESGESLKWVGNKLCLMGETGSGSELWKEEFHGLLTALCTRGETRDRLRESFPTGLHLICVDATYGERQQHFAWITHALIECPIHVYWFHGDLDHWGHEWLNLTKDASSSLKVIGVADTYSAAGKMRLLNELPSEGDKLFICTGLLEMAEAAVNCLLQLAGRKL